MKKNSIIFSLCVGAAAFTACTDTWDEHYNADNNAGGTRTLWELIQRDPELGNFAKVMKATHFDRDLNGSTMYTVWAAPITEAEANAWIDQYVQDSIAGLKYEDNKAVVRFVKNHVCLYNRTISSLTNNDTIKMLNGKFKYLSSDNIDGVKLTSSNSLATNGVLYTIENPLGFTSNVYEELFQNERISKFAEALRSYNKYELDVQSSVPGEIIDGKIHYLDSVLSMRNSFLTSYDCRINREDSLYLLYAPTNDVWDAQYKRYSSYFVYPLTTVGRDSLQEARTLSAIFCSRTFNLNPSVNPEMAKKNETMRDSMMSTMYSNYDWENYVFYHPFAEGGLFYQRDNVKCSNGYIYFDDKDYSIDVKHTFMVDATYPAISGSLWYYGSDDETGTKFNNAEELSQNPAVQVETVYSDSVTLADGTKERLHIYGDSYMFFSGKANNTTTTQFTYKLYRPMSGAYYNVYFVFMPAIAKNDPELGDAKLPTKFRAYKHEMDLSGVLGKGTGNAVRIMDPETGSRDFETKAGIVDTLCLLKAHQFNYTGLGGDNVANIYFTCYVTSGENGKTYTRNMRVNGYIMRPFETKEEAEADYQKYLESRNAK